MIVVLDVKNHQIIIVSLFLILSQINDLHVTYTNFYHLDVHYIHDEITHYSSQNSKLIEARPEVVILSGGPPPNYM